MGASFRSAPGFVGVAWQICRAGYLTCCTKSICATYTRIICACCYLAMFEILRDFWGYPIAPDAEYAHARRILTCELGFVPITESCQIFTSSMFLCLSKVLLRPSSTSASWSWTYCIQYRVPSLSLLVLTGSVRGRGVLPVCKRALKRQQSN